MAAFNPNPRTTPTMVKKVTSPDDVVANRVVVEMDDKIHWYRPNVAPFMTLVGKMRKRIITENRKFESLTKDTMPRTMTLSADSVTGSTTIVLNSGEGARVGANYLLRNARTGTIVMVPAAPAADTLTVVRPFGAAGTDADFVAGDTLSFLAPAFEDGSGKGSFRSVKETHDYNYAQIFRTGYGFTGRAMNTNMYGGDVQTTERKWQSIEHRRSLTRAFLYGQRHLYLGGTETRTATGGVKSFITSNVWNLNGTIPTENAFQEFLEVALEEGDGGYINGSGTKYGLFSARWITVINQFVGDRIRYKTLDKTIGFQAMEYQSPHGKLMILHDPVFDEENADEGLILDFNHITMRPFKNRDTKLLKNIQDNDIDGVEEEWMTDAGIQVDLQAAHSSIIGLDV